MGLLDGFLGAGEAFSFSMAQSTREQALMAEKERVEKERMAAAEEMARARIVWQKEYEKELRQERSKEVDSESKQIAQERGKGFINQARSAYSGNEEGLAAVADAEKRGAYAQEVTDEDRMRAEAKLGYRDTRDILALEHQKEQGIRQAQQDSYSKDRDAKSDEFKERELKLREKETSANRKEHELRYDMLKLQYDRALEENKIPAAVSKQYDALNKNYHDLLTISSKSDFDPTSDSGKKIVSDMSKVSEKLSTLLDPYIPKGKDTLISTDDLNKMIEDRRKNGGASGAQSPAEREPSQGSGQERSAGQRKFSEFVANARGGKELKEAKDALAALQRSWGSDLSKVTNPMAKERMADLQRKIDQLSA